MRFKKFLIKVLEYIRYKKSYSQDGEDVVLHSFFEGFNDYKGFYVDIGAHHPFRFSNTYFFYKRGWKGINIDPTPGSMIPFRFFRRRDINLELGIGKVAGEMTFNCFDDPALNSFNEELSEQRTLETKYKIIDRVKVEINTLNQILNKYLNEGTKIDFFSIDVEGLDLEVLQSNDWERFAPSFILVEDIGFDWREPEKSEIYKFLSSRKYRIVSMLKRTIIYELKK